MADVLGMIVPQNEQEEIKEFVSTLLLLPKEDRAILLSNANAFKVRRDIERARKWGENLERLIKEIIQIEKKRNSLLAEISESLKIIANRDCEKQKTEVGKSAFKESEVREWKRSNGLPLLKTEQKKSGIWTKTKILLRAMIC